MYEKILVPLDGSKNSEEALSYAALIAKTGDAQVSVLSVADGDGAKRWFSDYLYQQEQKLQQRGVNAVSLVTCGAAADEILNFAEKNEVQLIIMSSHGSGGMSRWTIGSVSNKVIRESYVPLLLIKTGAVPTASRRDSIRRMLVSLDGSRLSEEAIPFAVDLGNKLNSEIVLMRVNEAPRLAAYVSPEFVPGWDEYHQRAISGMQSGIQGYLEKMENTLQSQGVKVHTRTTSGEAAHGIISYAESNDIDVVAMTTHGQSGYSHWAFGSVADKVVHGVSKPVLLLRTKPGLLESGI